MLAAIARQRRAPSATSASAREPRRERAEQLATAQVDRERADRQLRQHQHDDQRQVRVLRVAPRRSRRQQVARQRPLAVCRRVVGSVSPGAGAPGRNASASRASTHLRRVDDA